MLMHLATTASITLIKTALKFIWYVLDRVPKFHVHGHLLKDPIIFHSLCMLFTSFLLQAFSSSRVIFRMSRSSCRLSACIRASYWAPVCPCVVWKRIKQSVNYYTKQKPLNIKHQTNNFGNNLVTLAANYKWSRRTNHDMFIHICYSMNHTSPWTFLFSQRHAIHKEFPHSHFYLPP
jgi:hypothetical protein